MLLAGLNTVSCFLSFSCCHLSIRLISLSPVSTSKQNHSRRLEGNPSAASLVHIAEAPPKPENLLCTRDRRVKLIDLGNARSFGDTDAYVGTPAFMPPELCYGLPYPSQQQPSLALTLFCDTGGKSGGAMPSRDVWSLGICLYCFIFGRVPFMDQTLIAVCDKIQSEPYVPPQ